MPFIKVYIRFDWSTKKNELPHRITKTNWDDFGFLHNRAFDFAQAPI